MRTWRAAVCLMILLGVAGCGWAETSARNRDVREENRQVYEVYRAYLESTNAQRQQAGLPPKPVKEYEEWRQSPSAE